MIYIITILVSTVAIYIVGIAVYIDMRTTENVKVHDNGFLGLPYTTSSNRDTNSKDARVALLWPALALLFIIKAFIWILNDCVSYVSLIFGLRYKDTRLYRYIESINP